jgi:hypothetical protein
VGELSHEPLYKRFRLEFEASDNDSHELLRGDGFCEATQVDSCCQQIDSLSRYARWKGNRNCLARLENPCRTLQFR